MRELAPLRFLLVAMLWLIGTSLKAQGPILLSDGWIRAAPPTSAVRAGYVVIHNPGERGVRILGASSPHFGNVEFHETVLEDGMMRIRAQSELHIAAGETLRMQPGGLHLMLFEPTGSPAVGEELAVDFHLYDGQQVSTLLTVKRGL